MAVGVLYTINAWLSGYSFGSEFIRDYAYLFYTDDTTYAALQTAMGQTPPQPTMPLYAGITGGSATLTILLGLLLLLLVRQHEHPHLARRRARPLLDGLRPSAAAQARRGGRLGQPDVGQPLPRHLRLRRRADGVRRLDRRRRGPAQTLALLDFGALFFIWPMGLAAIMFLPFLRTDLFEKSTFQYTWGGVPVITIIGVACFWWAGG